VICYPRSLRLYYRLWNASSRSFPGWPPLERPHADHLVNPGLPLDGEAESYGVQVTLSSSQPGFTATDSVLLDAAMRQFAAALNKPGILQTLGTGSIVGCQR
jgi:hypothetical protein